MSTPTEPNKHVISCYVRNKPGVLVRVALTFSRRGYNIESLVVSPGRSDEFSRMTITSLGDPSTLEQIIKQLNKLIDVVSAFDHTDQDVIDSEIALVKVAIPLDGRTALLQIVEHYHGKVVDYGSESVIIRIAGASSKLNAFVELCNQWDIKEVVRSGQLVMARGNELT